MRAISLALVILQLHSPQTWSLGGKRKPMPRDEISRLNLRASWINDSDLLEVARLPQLADLDLSETRITDIGFQQLKGSRERFASEPLLRGADRRWALAAMREWKQLRHLNLRGTKVTDAGLVHLAGLPMESLDVGFSLFTDNGFENLVGLTATHAAGSRRQQGDRHRSELVTADAQSLELDFSGAEKDGLWPLGGQPSLTGSSRTGLPHADRIAQSPRGQVQRERDSRNSTGRGNFKN